MFSQHIPTYLDHKTCDLNKLTEDFDRQCRVHTQSIVCWVCRSTYEACGTLCILWTSSLWRKCRGFTGLHFKVNKLFKSLATWASHENELKKILAAARASFYDELPIKVNLCRRPPSRRVMESKNERFPFKINHSGNIAFPITKKKRRVEHAIFNICERHCISKTRSTRIRTEFSAHSSASYMIWMHLYAGKSHTCAVAPVARANHIAGVRTILHPVRVRTVYYIS